MKNLFIVLVALMAVQCDGPSEQGIRIDSPVDKFFVGHHALSPIDRITKEYPDKKNAYIVLQGTGEKSTATFFWRQGEGFIQAILPLSKVRLSPVPPMNIDTPYCKFCWKSDGSFRSEDWKNFLSYVVIFIEENQIIRENDSTKIVAEKP
jgi:hypothetical protein